MKFIMNIDSYMFRHRLTIQWGYQYLHQRIELVFLSSNRLFKDGTQVPKHVGVNSAEMYFTVIPSHSQQEATFLD